MTDWYDPETAAPDDADLAYGREAQPDDFCECRPGVEMRHGWQHAPECLRWSPPLVGSGSTDAHREAVMAYCRTVIADSRARHQEAPR